MLDQIARLEGASKSAIVARAVERYRRERILEQANDARARVLAKPEAVADLKAEDDLWDRTVGDGLEDEAW
jgi:hypothetical protein